MGSKAVAFDTPVRRQAVQMAQVPIQHRRTRFDFSNVPPHWLDGDPFMTRFIDALSVHFPDGERFFMDSVRNYEQRVTDDKLRHDIRQFIRQEAQHGNAHEQYNAMLQEQGINAKRIVGILKAEARGAQKLLPKKIQLALTAAAEHLTATLGEGILEVAPELLRTSHPEMRAMYFWHAVEEVEHKAVAYDTYYGAADGDYASRAAAMVIFTLWLHVKVARVMNHMLRQDKVANRPMVFARGAWKLYGPRGLLTKIAPRYFAWFKPGFHPFDTALPPLAAAWIAEYEKHQDPKLATAVAFGELAPQEAQPA